MLKDTWTNKVDGVDINSADDINQVAQAVIDLENKKVEITVDDELNETSVNPVQNKVITAKINDANNKAQTALDDAGNANALASQNQDTIETELKPNIETALSESGQAYTQVSEALGRIDNLQIEKADVIYVDEKIGDIDSALEELHNYAQALIGGVE